MSPLSISRFPDELVLEIFRDQCFSTSDLTRLALVSRRFLPSIKPLLYEVIPLELVPHRGEDQPMDLVYNVKSWKLLKVLEAHDDLAAMVKEVRYDKLWEPEEGALDNPRISAVGTTDELALTTFLRIAKNATVLTFFEALHNGVVYLESFARYGPKISTLRLRNCIATRPEGPTDSERNITQLKASRIYGNSTEEFVYPNLTHLDLEDEEVKWSDISYLDSVLPNLEVLKITVKVAVELDFSKMPRLQYLHLYNINDQGAPLTSTTSFRVAEFWGSLSRAPSIKTLSFEACAYECKYEMLMFDARYLGYCAPTLKTIRFDCGVRLDRVKRILDGKLSESLVRFLIPTCQIDYGPRSDSRREREARAIVAMCEGTGIEVLHEDSQEVLWDRWCELI